PQGILPDGRKVTPDLFRATLQEELNALRTAIGEQAYESANYERAARLFDDLTVNDDFVEFLTIPGYALLD
ncbi:MAG: malate synthase A, partial [Chloroflexia bacterium]